MVCIKKHEVAQLMSSAVLAAAGAAPPTLHLSWTSATAAHFELVYSPLQLRETTLSSLATLLSRYYYQSLLLGTHAPGSRGSTARLPAAVSGYITVDAVCATYVLHHHH